MQIKKLLAGVLSLAMVSMNTIPAELTFSASAEEPETVSESEEIEETTEETAETGESATETTEDQTLQGTAVPYVQAQQTELTEPTTALQTTTSTSATTTTTTTTTVATTAATTTAATTTTEDYHPAATVNVGEDAMNLRYFGFGKVQEYNNTLIKDIYCYGYSGDDSVMDIYPNTLVNQYIAVNFTVEGLGDKHCYQNYDGTDGKPYYATLVGYTSGYDSVTGMYGSNSSTDSDYQQETPCERVYLNGDGTYTVVWQLLYGNTTISRLALKTNIRYTEFEGATSAEDCGLQITINSIKTGPYVKPDIPMSEPTATTTAIATAIPATKTTTVATTAYVIAVEDNITYRKYEDHAEIVAMQIPEGQTKVIVPDTVGGLPVQAVGGGYSYYSEGESHYVSAFLVGEFSTDETTTTEPPQTSNAC